MATKRIPIEDANAEQLRDFAIKHLGIEVDAGTSKTKLLAKIRPAYDKADIEIEELEDTVHNRRAGYATAKATPQHDEKITVVIHRQEGPGGDEPVLLAVNGRNMLVERSKPSPIPPSYYEVLRHAIKTTYEQDKDGNMIPRDVPQYPHSVLAGA